MRDDTRDHTGDDTRDHTGDDLSNGAGLPLWSEYPAFVRRHRARIAVLVLLGLVVGLVLTWRQPASYSATATVVLTPVPKYVTPSTTELVPPEVTIDTDAQLLRSPEVLDALEGVAGIDVEAVSDHLGVSASPNSHVLHVTATASSANAAADAANAAVSALAEVRRRTLGGLRHTQLRQLRLLIAYQQQLLAKEGSDGAVIPAYDDLATEILELQTGLDQLEDTRRHPTEVINPAQPPRHADYANREVPLTSGAMVGLLCACLLGAAQDRAARLATHSPTHHPTHRPPDVLPGVAIHHEDYHHAV